jgi:signal transduction histidine kinase
MAILGVTLLIYATLVNVLLVWNTQSLIDRELIHEAQKVHQLTDAQLGAALDRQSVVVSDLSQTLSPDILVQVMAPDGQMLVRSASVGPSLFSTDNQMLAQALDGRSHFVTLERQGIWLRAYLSPLTSGDRVVGLLWVARSLETLGAALDWLQIILAGAAVLALFVAGVWGRQLARSAFRPVDDMTLTAQSIGQTQDFGRRVLYTGAPDELGRLADTFNSMLSSLQAAYERTENALAAQRRFVADASHELRTPLTSLRGNVGVLRHMLAQRPATPEQSIDILNDVEHELARLSRLVDGLLILARADAGQHIIKTPVDLSETVRSVVRQFQSHSTPLTLSLECQDELMVTGSVDHLIQLTRILLDNAIAYTPAGGQVNVVLRRKNGEAELCVSDTGIGIGADDLPNIFARFYRGRAARGLRADGAGLGLAIAAWIVAEHSGEISASSELEKGSSFTIRLPAISPQDACTGQTDCTGTSPD